MIERTKNHFDLRGSPRPPGYLGDDNCDDFDFLCGDAVEDALGPPYTSEV